MNAKPLQLDDARPTVAYSDRMRADADAFIARYRASIKCDLSRGCVAGLSVPKETLARLRDFTATVRRQREAERRAAGGKSPTGIAAMFSAALDADDMSAPADIRPEGPTPAGAGGMERTPTP